MGPRDDVAIPSRRRSSSWLWTEASLAQVERDVSAPELLRGEHAHGHAEQASIRSKNAVTYRCNAPAPYPSVVVMSAK